MELKDLKYKIRASSSLALVTSCSTKVTNKLEWVFDEKKKDDFTNESFIKIAVAVYNKLERGYEEPEVFAYNLENGKKNEPLGVKMYDKRFGTKYFQEYIKKDRNLQFEKSNEYGTGTCDFGEEGVEIIDAKNSTCLNVYLAKKFIPLEPKYIAQMNTYGKLYNAPKLKLYNFLTPKSIFEIEKMVNSKRNNNYETYTKAFGLSHTNPEITDAEIDKFQESVERMYTYSEFDGYTLDFCTDVREIPIIANWETTLYKSVEKMNRFIEKNKNKF